MSVFGLDTRPNRNVRFPPKADIRRQSTRDISVTMSRVRMADFDPNQTLATQSRKRQFSLLYGFSKETI